MCLGLALTGGGGCNAVYFYETEKVSVTLEARPDPTSPVSGNIGIKQRIATVIPPTRSSADGAKEAGATTRAVDVLDRQARGDAMSVVSAFRFHKYPVEKGAVLSRVTIDAALITGAAAQSLSNGEVNRSIAALSGAGAGERPMTWAAMAQVYEGLKAVAAADPGSVAADRVAALDALAGELPDAYPMDVYRASGEGVLILEHPRGSAVARGNFLEVGRYEAMLNGSADALLAAAGELDRGESVTIRRSGEADQVLTAAGGAAADGLRKRADDNRKAVRELRARIGDNPPAVAAAVRAYFGL